MTPQVEIVETASAAPPPQAAGGFEASERLRDCTAKLREHLRNPSVSHWLKENQALIQSHIGDLRQTFRPSWLEKLRKNERGEPRIYRIVTGWLANVPGAIDNEVLLPFAETLRETEALEIGELWAFAPMLKFAIVERLCANLDSERLVASCVRTLWALEAISWKTFIENASRTEAALKRDPAGVYARMNLATRDRYRLELSRLASEAKVSEEDAANALLERAEQARTSAAADPRKFHVGYYLVGAGAKEFRRRLGCKRSFTKYIPDFAQAHPNVCYTASALILMGLIMAAFVWLTGPLAWWMIALLMVPASQAALEITNAVLSRLLSPRFIPSLDFSGAIPDDCKTLVVVPTLLYSESNCAKLLHDLEIRYLANRDRNLFFALLTDFSDAPQAEVESDRVLRTCSQGIRQLNERYGAGLSGSADRGPFYLLHRARRWNPQERKWMGHERKRGKLNDLNKLLLGRENWFNTIVGDMGRLAQMRYVITLDTDTQLPRDTAARMIGAMAHPLNAPILDEKTNMVTEGHALLRPQVAISVDSTQRSWIARIFGGQPGFDPYSASVSDIYHDLHGVASFTGKGIYDVRAFAAAVGERFPENAILSHDLIEGEHARTGLVPVELVEDYPATYGAFSKRKHRWVRGDWQLLPWLFPHPPEAQGRARTNPLSALSRWKIVDNLRRSLLEISLLILLVAGWLATNHQVRWTIAVLLLLQIPAYVDMLLNIVRAPERRFWKAFGKLLGERFVQSHRDTLLNVVFIPHQACLMADAIVRTLWRRYVSHSNLLEWESMAQSELGGTRFGLFDVYLYASSLIWLPFLFLAGPIPILVALVCALWVTTPLVVGWLNEPLPQPDAVAAKDRDFLRETALRTWRYFADHSWEEHHWLVPDNIQENPSMVAHHISPTNLGLSLTAQLAAHDFGYLSLNELAHRTGRILDSLEDMPRYRGHFFNWYHTGTRQPLTPQYVSSVDSGNLAGSLTALRQGCLLLSQQRILNQSILEGLRDHALRLRNEVPYESRTFSTMKLFHLLVHHLECRPADLFYWEEVLTESKALLNRVKAALVSVHARSQSVELRYWENLLSERMDAVLDELYRLAPWLRPEFEPELRVNMRDATFTPLIAELSKVPALGELPRAYDRVRERLVERLSSARPLYPMLRGVLEQLLRELPVARTAALDLAKRFQGIAEVCQRYFDDMDFGFLFDENRRLLRIGYNVEADKGDQSHYDLLASEARTAVFLAIAKGDIPRETWLKLGRKLTAYRDHVTLLAWSGTMFEYLMPQLHLRAYPGTLLDRALRAAVRAHAAYGAERGVPWGISEAAYADRDPQGRYQYRAFGVPPLAASGEEARRLVIAPYASMLGVMVDPVRATQNLRTMAARGWWSRYGFFESIDYGFAPPAQAAPEPVHCFMAHHQGMALLAISNALLGNRMQERFHHDPLVQATEFLLEERMPALVDVTPVPEAA
ncbi:MAG TPA: glucoamylase family protein [Bryobacteraceae bacterium]|nr:glucoamylase family protein [Bryobacteraceae bacterium]